MTTLVSKWGNSLGVRIPKKFAEQMQLGDGDAVDLSFEGGALIVRPATRRYSIEELVAGISPKNRHARTDWGPARGREQW